MSFFFSINNDNDYELMDGWMDVRMLKLINQSINQSINQTHTYQSYQKPEKNVQFFFCLFEECFFFSLRVCQSVLNKFFFRIDLLLVVMDNVQTFVIYPS